MNSEFCVAGSTVEIQIERLSKIEEMLTAARNITL